LLSNNTFTGSIPYSFGQLISLDSLYLSNNTLTGSIPDSIGQLTKLQVLEVDHNHLTGLIPNSLGDLTNVLYLCDLANNDFSCPIPINLPAVCKSSAHCNSNKQRAD